MFKKIKKLKLEIEIKYYFAGLVVSIIVFQLIKLILSKIIDFTNQDFIANTIILLISVITGAAIGGILYISFLNPNKQIEIDKQNWEKIKSKGYKAFYYLYMFAFALGLFVYQFLFNLFDISAYNFKSLFSYQNIITYISMIIAGATFGFIFATGKIKRLKSIYE